MSDSLADVLDRLRRFRDERGWQQYHTPDALARAVMVEAGELNDLFLWSNNPEPCDIEPEVADVMIYCLNLCMAADINPLEAIAWKISQNEIRKPLPFGRLSPHHDNRGLEHGSGPTQIPNPTD